MEEERVAVEGTNTVNSKIPIVKQKDARILREALSGLYSKVPPMAQRRILTALSDYGSRVGEYCECPERSFVTKERKWACLDCGKRFQFKGSNTELTIAGKDEENN